MFLLMLQALIGAPIPPPIVPTNPDSTHRAVVVIDAGHGSLNPGVRFKFMHGGKKRTIVEKAYTCDIAARVKKILADSLVETATTTKGKCLDEPSEGNLLDATPIGNELTFATNGKVVRGNESGIRERIKFAANSGFLSTDTILVSIHVDSATLRSIEGSYVIVSPGRRSSPLAMHIAESLGEIGPMREFCRDDMSPVVEAGKCGMKKILLLIEAPVEETVLVELLHVSNESDRTKLLDPKWRQKYAEALALGIIDYIRLLPAAGS